MHIDLADIKLTPLGKDILSFLNKQEFMNVIDIRKKLDLNSEKLMKELARLEGGLLIQIVPSGSDQRFKEVSITKYGIEKLKEGSDV